MLRDSSFTVRIPALPLYLRKSFAFPRVLPHLSRLSRKAIEFRFSGLGMNAHDYRCKCHFVRVYAMLKPFF